MAPTLDGMKGEAFTLTDGPNSSPTTSQLPQSPTAGGSSAAGNTCTLLPTSCAHRRSRVLYIPPEHAAAYESAEFTSLSRITATRTYRGKHSDTQGQVQHLCEWADSTMLGRQLAANKHLLRHVAHRTPVAHIAAAPRAGIGRKSASQTRTACAAPAFLRRSLPRHLRAPAKCQLAAAIKQPDDAIRVRWKPHWCHLTPALLRTHARALAAFQDNPTRALMPPRATSDSPGH
jgi:hypothetical protein